MKSADVAFEKKADNLTDGLMNLSSDAGLSYLAMNLLKNSKALGNHSKEWKEGLKALGIPENVNAIHELTPEQVDGIVDLYTKTSNKYINSPLLLGITTKNGLNGIAHAKAIAANPGSPSQWLPSNNPALKGNLHHYDVYAHTTNPNVAGTHQINDVLRYLSITPAQERLNIMSGAHQELPAEVMEAIHSGRGAKHVSDVASKWFSSLPQEAVADNLGHLANINDAFNGRGYTENVLKDMLGLDYSGNPVGKTFEGDPNRLINGTARAILTESGKSVGDRLRNLENWYNSLNESDRAPYSRAMEMVRGTYKPELQNAGNKIYAAERASAPLRSKIYEFDKAPEELKNIANSTNMSFSDKLREMDRMAAGSQSPDVKKGVDTYKSLITGKGTLGGIGKGVASAGKGYAGISKAVSRAGKGLGAAGLALGAAGAGTDLYRMLKSGSVRQSSDDSNEIAAISRLLADLTAQGVPLGIAINSIQNRNSAVRNLFKDLLNPSKSVGFTYGKAPKIGNGHAAPSENLRRLIELDPRFKEYGLDLHNIETSKEGVQGDVLINPETGKPIIGKNGKPLREAHPMARDYNAIINTGMGDASAWNRTSQVGDVAKIPEHDITARYGRAPQTMFNIVMDDPSAPNGYGATKEDVGLGYGPVRNGEEKDGVGADVRSHRGGGKILPIKDRVFVTGTGDFITEDGKDLTNEAFNLQRNAAQAPYRNLIREELDKFGKYKLSNPEARQIVNDALGMITDTTNAEDAKRIAERAIEEVGAKGYTDDYNALKTYAKNNFLDRPMSTTEHIGRFLRDLTPEGSKLSWLRPVTNSVAKGFESLSAPKLSRLAVKEGTGTFVLDPITMASRKNLLQQVKSIAEENTARGLVSGMEGYANPKQPIINRIETLLADPNVTGKMSPRTVTELTNALNHVKNGGDLMTIIGSGRGDYNEARLLSLMDSVNKAGDRAKNMNILSMHGNEFNNELSPNNLTGDAGEKLGEAHYDNIQELARRNGLGGRVGAVGKVQPELYQLYQMLATGNLGSTGNLAISESNTGGTPTYIPKDWYDEAREDGTGPQIDRNRSIYNRLMAITGKAPKEISAPYVALSSWNRGAIDHMLGLGMYKNTTPSATVKELPQYTGGEAYTSTNRAYANTRSLARQLYGMYDYDPSTPLSNFWSDKDSTEAPEKFSPELKQKGYGLLKYDPERIDQLRNKMNQFASNRNTSRLTDFNNRLNYYDKINKGVEHLVGQNFNTDAVLNDVLDHPGTNLTAVNDSLHNITNTEKAQAKFQDALFNKVMSNARKTRVRAGAQLTGLAAPFIGGALDVYTNLHRKK